MGFVVQKLMPEESSSSTISDEMNLDIRNQTEVYMVFRREGPNEYHFQGVACAVEEFSAEQVAISMCRDETYFIFPCLINTVLSHSIIKPKGLYFPLKK